MLYFLIIAAYYLYASLQKTQQALYLELFRTRPVVEFLVPYIIYSLINKKMRHGLFPQDDISKRVPLNPAVI
jgi:hypothetical protein